MKTTLVSRLLCAAALISQAAEPAQAIEAAVKSAQTWTADFIWSDRKGPDNPPVTYFRKNFDLTQVPKSATLTATGCRFKLFVNGEFAGEGVPHNVANSAYTVSFEVAKLLRKGGNVIAVEAQFANPSRNSRVPPLFSASLEADGQRIATDDSWKVFVSPAWGIVEGHSSGRDFVEVFDSKKDPAGWKVPGFKDARWAAATVAPSVKYAAITPAIIPNFQREKILPAAVTATGEVVQILGDARVNVGLQLATETLRPLKFGKITNPENLLKSGAFTVIEPQVYVDDLLAYDTWWEKRKEMPVMRDVSFIVDFDAIRNGYIAMDIEGNEGATVDVAWGQTLIDGRVPPILYSRGDRDSAGRADHQYALRWNLRGGRERFESMNYKSFRYLQVTVRDLTEPLKIHEVAAVRSFVPMKQRGKFACSDPFLTDLFAASLRTLQAASYDTFFDNTIREKNIWGGDISDGSVPTALAGYGDNPMTRNYIDLFTRSQHPNGELTLIAGSEMPSTGMALMMHPMRTAIWMERYGLWSGDPDYVKTQIVPALLKYRDYWKGRNNPAGLVTIGAKEGGGPMEQTWIDWSSNAWQTDFKPGPDSVLVPWNLLYVRFLEDLAVLLDGSEAAACRAEAKAITDWVYVNCWDDVRGLYFEGFSKGTPVRTFSEHANFLALACGLGRDGRAPRIVKAFAEMKPGAERIVRSQAPFLIWPFEGLFAAGADKAALDLMRDRYRRFTLNDGKLDCFWEEYSYLLGQSGWHARYRSLAQNGAGSPAYHLLTQVIGVSPTKPGFAEFTIRPQPGDLEWAEGVVPSPKGDIPVRVERKGGKLTLGVTVPDGTAASVFWPDGKSATLNPGKHALTGSGKP
jgi:alpha-L-rhamnosidase